MPRIRVMTYNVHRCVGAGGRDSTEAITCVLREADADVVALQELDAPDDDAAVGPHHARDIARPLGMRVLFCRTFARGAGHYGHALLSRHPVELRRSSTLPLLDRPGSEPRGAIWAVVRGPDFVLNVVSTHLGVRRVERAWQSAVLLGPDWVGHADFQRHGGIVCGDFNALPLARTHRRFARVLNDAQRMVGRPQPTFPSVFPVLRIDHVFISPGLRAHAASVPSSHAARRASDHLPLIVDLEVPRVVEEGASA